jgi:hypothetical protein
MGRAYCRNIKDNRKAGTSGLHGEIVGTLRMVIPIPKYHSRHDVFNPKPEIAARGKS